MTRPVSARRLGALLRKELYGFFAQPLLYVVGTFFLLLAGYYFYSDLVFFVTFGFGENIFENFFQLLFADLRLVIMVTAPLLTMRLFAEEKKLGTIELLFTYPLRDLEIYLAKLLACTGAVLALLAATAPTLWWLHRLQPFAIGPVLVGYGGLALLALSFVALGLLLSGLTDNQVVAAMSTLGALLLLWMLSWNEPAPGTWPVRLSMFDHFESFSRGVVETRDVAYFACLVLFAAVACLQVLGARSWRGARLAPTLVGLAGLLAALGFADALAERHSLRFDLTPQKKYTLSPHARRILDRLSRDVEVVAFVRSADPANAATIDLLERLDEASPRVHHRVVDVNRNPAMARRYGVDAYGAVVVESGGERRVFQSAREGHLVGAMLELTRSAPLAVGFVGTRPEESSDGADRQRGFGALATALADEGVVVRSLDLEAGIPEDTAVLVIVGRRAPWSPGVLGALDAWLGRGGRLLALLDPLTAPQLSSWLAAIGIAPRADVVLDPENRLYGGEGVSIEARAVRGAVPRVPGAESARLVADRLDHGVLLSFARSLDVSPEAVPLLESGPESWATADLDLAQRGFASFDGSRDARGPLAVAGAREWTPVAGARPARVVVVGDAEFASNGFLEFLANKDFVQNAISWLAGDEDLIALRARRKELGRQQFFLSAGQARRALWLGVVVLPGASALVAALLLGWRRLGR